MIAVFFSFFTYQLLKKSWLALRKKETGDNWEKSEVLLKVCRQWMKRKTMPNEQGLFDATVFLSPVYGPPWEASQERVILINVKVIFQMRTYCMCQLPGIKEILLKLNVAIF